jgi:uncharacterized protein YfiM (DUF2279 family)
MSVIHAARRWPVLVLLVSLSPQPADTAQSGSTTAAPPSAPAEVSLIDPVRLERAHARLVQIAGTFTRDVPLAELLTLMLRPNGSDDVMPRLDEHRAALVAVAFYVTRWPIERLLPDARTWPRPTMRSVTLGGRRDHAQHFIVSAAMAATAGSPLADALGVYKEIRDSQSGSGFSFSDVAANRAGQRFGTLASGSPTSAASLAHRLRAPLTDRDIMPATAGLPDSLNGQEFARRYGTTSSVAFTQLVDDIDRRVSALALYR